MAVKLQPGRLICGGHGIFRSLMGGMSASRDARSRGRSANTQELVYALLYIHMRLSWDEAKSRSNQRKAWHQFRYGFACFSRSLAP